MEYEVERAKNAAANARMFCLGMAMVALHAGFRPLALLWLMPIGLSYAADCLPLKSTLYSVASICTFTATAIAAVLSLIVI